MPEENVAIVRSICAAWDRGDYGSGAWAHPDIEFVIVGGPSPGAWTGLAGMAEGWRAWLSAWEDFRQEANEYRVVDDERVLVSFWCTGRGKASGFDLAEMHARLAGLFHLRDGRVTRFVGYYDRAAALDAAGLRE